MPKVKIGEKVTVGAIKSDEMKRFNNGHKVFTAQEAKRLLETQAVERRTVERFEKNLDKLVRPRNPILGDETPRSTYDNKGNSTHIMKTTYLLSDERVQTVKQQREAQPEKEPNVLYRTDARNERISSLQNLQDNIGGELEYLKMKLKNQEAQIAMLNKEQSTARY